MSHGAAYTAEIIERGAPSKITPALLKRADQFLAGGWRKYNKTVPTIEGLAKHLGLYRTYVYACQELSDTVEQIQTLQSMLLIDGALANEYNPSIAKLLLSSKHGYVEKSEVANTHEMVSPQAPQVAEDFQAYVNAKTLITDGTKAQD